MAARRYRDQTTRVLAVIVKFFWLVGAVIGAVGIFYYKKAGSDSESAKGLSILYMSTPFFGAGLVIFLIGLYWARLTATAETHGELWMRWTCPPDDAKRFLASERKRLKVSPQMYWLAILLGLVLGLLGALTTGQRSNPYFLVLGPLGMAGLFVVLTPVMARLEFKRSAQLVRSETMVRSTGLFACDNYYPWRNVNWALANVLFEPGGPAVIQFDFFTGKLANSSPPSGGTYTIRAPVPKALEDDAKLLVSRFKR